MSRTSTAGFSFADNTTTRIRNGGSFTTPSYFDLGNATLDVNNGFLTVGTTGGTISDWGGSGATTTATLTASAVATYNSGLRMGVLGGGGTTNATVSGGARLVSNGSFSAGGGAASNVSLNVTGGRVESDGLISLQRGVTTTVSAAGVIEGQDVVLGSSLGTATTTVTGASSLLKARGTLFAGRTGTSGLTISAGAKAESLGSTIIGELAGANATVTVAGSSSRLDVGSSLTVGAGGTGALNIDAGGFVPVVGGVTVGSSGTLFLSGGSLETSVGQSITNSGVISAIASSQIRADLVSSGNLTVFEASITRGVTLQANSQISVDNATFGSLTQQANASIDFSLFSATDFDDLAVTGAASLAGQFVISLNSVFTPTAGMTFPIFTAGSITGTPTFDFSAASLPSGLGWVTVAGPTSISLAVISVPVLAGDYNSDGVVDAADYTRWRDNVGAPAGTLPNDPAGGVIGAAQYNQWAANYGASGMMLATAQGTSVPEPAAAALLLVGLASGYLRRG